MNDALPPLVSSRLAECAASLDERLAAPPSMEPPLQRTPSELLSPWIQAFSPGDPEALLRRLAWDGLELPHVLHAVGAPLAHPHAEWTDWVARFVGEAHAVAARSPAELPALPFVELWSPVARAARAELARRAGPLLASLSPAALLSLEERLLREASSLGEQAALERFRALHPAPTGEASSSEAYRAFVRQLLGGELVAFFSEFPVLARLLATLAETWVAANTEMLERLARDRRTLAERFGSGRDLGGVEAIAPGLGDRHHGGRRVVCLSFAGGLRVVYKPRDVRLEQAWSALVAWAAGRGLDVTPPLAVLERPGYGWVEFAEQRPFADEAGVRRYYRRSGALLALVHVLRGRDLHMENVVATIDGPQLVDAEMLLQPEKAAARDGGAGLDGSASFAIEDSCLGSGLLSLLQADGQGGRFDIGGLRGSGSGRPPIARRVWDGLGTDAIGFVREARLDSTATNAVVLDGEVCRPDDYADEIVAGFTSAYELLRSRRDDLLAPNGAFRAFSGRPVRVLFRTTTQYGALQYVLTSPPYQRSGLRRSFALDALNRCFAGERERPALWPLAADERQALEQLDVPRFTIDSCATTVQTASGETISGHFERCGYAAAKSRLRRLSEDDLGEQLEILRGALGTAVDARFATRPPDPGPERALEATLVAHAEWIANELLSRARQSSRGLHWPVPPYAGSGKGMGPLRLYDGATGPVLLFAALGAVTGEARWRDAAQAALREVLAMLEAAGSGERRLEDDEPIGGATGLASVAYALGLTASLLGESSPMEAALCALRLVSADRVRADERLDAAGGSAGAVLVSCALYRLTGESWLLDRALSCAGRLLETAVTPAPGLAAWRSADGRLLAGMGHGAAGIALALVTLAELSGERRLADTARKAWAYERSIYSKAQGNWPVVGASSGATPVMAAWCHGAPGIGLARALSPVGHSDDPRLRDEIEAAMATTCEAVLRGQDHLCCGRLGRADALLTAGLVLDRGPWLEAARAAALQVATRAAGHGRFVLPSSEFECRTFHPGFFKGLAGVGYQLLRVAAPARVPSVLGWQLPVAEASGGFAR